MITLSLPSGPDAPAKDDDWKNAQALVKEDGSAAITALLE